MVDFIIIVDLRINETLQTGAVRIPHLPFSSSRIHGIPINRDLVGTVSNCAYAVRLETAPTGDESVYLFFDFTIIDLYKAAGVLTFDSCLY